MTNFVPLTDRDDWYPAYRRRRLDAHLALGVPAAAAEALVDQSVDPEYDWTAVAIDDADGRRVGRLVLGIVRPQGTPVGRIVELWTDPALDADGGHRRAARGWARAWCAERAAQRMSVVLAEPDETFADLPIRAQSRFKAIASAPEGPSAVLVRPMAEDEFPAWLAEEKEQYVADIVRSGVKTPEEARKQAEQDYLDVLPDGLATPETTVLTVESAGVPVASVWLRHNYLPGVSFLYSVTVGAEHRGRGLGRSAMVLADRAVVAAGDLALLFNVFGGNHVALSLYDSAGYAVLDESRSLPLDG
ncbi:GNAT family N-acetyltransferase [Kitasatospora terrestris]|uniref:N-acetyltransferase domain-containing protein n=1 Tax=Kitasatospora terrestris TaxID=258051 RepID=A0ABP9DAD8_9ACTN